MGNWHGLLVQPREEGTPPELMSFQGRPILFDLDDAADQEELRKLDLVGDRPGQYKLIKVGKSLTAMSAAEWLARCRAGERSHHPSDQATAAREEASHATTD